MMNTKPFEDMQIPDDAEPAKTNQAASSSDTTQATIKLDQFLKFSGAVQTGGEAKMLIQSGEVRVNGKVETQRGRKLVTGDRVRCMGETFTVELSG